MQTNSYRSEPLRPGPVRGRSRAATTCSKSCCRSGRTGAGDARWSRTSARRDPQTVLDVATGTAGVALALTRTTNAQITGIDITEAMLRRRSRTRRASRRRADRVRLVVGQAERLPFPDASFDALTFTYLLRYVADPAATLRELARVLKPGAAIASLEFSVPPNRFWRFWWWLYTRGVLAGRGLPHRRS